MRLVLNNEENSGSHCCSTGKALEMLWENKGSRKLAVAENQTQVAWLELPGLYTTKLQQLDNHQISQSSCTNKTTHTEWLLGVQLRCSAVQDCEVFACMVLLSNHETRQLCFPPLRMQWRETRLSKRLQNSSTWLCLLTVCLCLLSASTYCASRQ